MNIKIIKPGIYTTVQDLGRVGYRSTGTSPGGAMDFFAASVANYLVGNDVSQPLIEMHFPAAEILFECDAMISITGADFNAHINDREVKNYQPLFVKKNEVLSFKKFVSGARAYLAITSGIQAEKWLGSYSTHIKMQAGGFKGRILQKDDILLLNEESNLKPGKIIFFPPESIHSVFENPFIIRCIKGPESDMLEKDAVNQFQQNSFRITSQSDRMGYRMNGNPLTIKKGIELISSPVSFGTIQLLPNGQLIILMADHQTTGGYPRIANVISADLPKLAQLPVNSCCRFTFISVDEAEEIVFSMHQKLEAIRIMY